MKWQPIVELPKIEWKEEWFYKWDYDGKKEIAGSEEDPFYKRDIVCAESDYLFAVKTEYGYFNYIFGCIGTDKYKKVYPCFDDFVRLQKLEDVTHFCKIAPPEEGDL